MFQYVLAFNLVDCEATKHLLTALACLSVRTQMSKEELMEKISSQVRVCTKCRLSKCREKAVPGQGDPDAEVMFVGEAPGRQEDLFGLPFVGDAGRVLDEFLAKIEFSRSQIYITNIVKCRPPRNRAPRVGEIRTCARLYLTPQVQIVRPRFLVTLGRHSAAFVLSRAGFNVGQITKFHGRVYKARPFGFSILVVPIIHPAAALYKREYRKLLEEGFEVLKSRVKQRIW